LEGINQVKSPKTTTCICDIWENDIAWMQGCRDVCRSFMQSCSHAIIQSCRYSDIQASNIQDSIIPVVSAANLCSFLSYNLSLLSYNFDCTIKKIFLIPKIVL